MMAENIKPDATEVTFNIRKFKRRLCLINWVFHFVRNKPRTTNMVYYGLISALGYDKWENTSEEVHLRQSVIVPWNNASNSYDKMYGLVKAWAYYGWNPLVETKTEPKSPEQIEEEKRKKEENDARQALKDENDRKIFEMSLATELAVAQTKKAEAFAKLHRAQYEAECYAEGKIPETVKQTSDYTKKEK